MKLITPLALLLLAVSQSGCVTSTLWKEAIDGKLKSPNSPGSIVVPDDRRGVAPRMVLDYGSDVSVYEVVVPTDSTGRIIPPLAYNGSANTLEELKRELSDQDVKAIQSYRFDPPDRRPLLGMKRASYVRRNEFNNLGRYGLPWPEKKCVLFAVDPQGRAIPFEPLHGESKTCPGQRMEPIGRFPANCQILIVPSEQPAPPDQYAMGLISATMFTPIALVFDVFITPAVLLHQPVEF